MLLSILPIAAEQTRHALLLLGAPASVRLLVDVHAALFDGDLGAAAVTELLRVRAPEFCCALDADLTARAGLVALADWPLERRIVTPAARKAQELAMSLRVAEFVGLRAHAGPGADRLLRGLGVGVPNDLEVTREDLAAQQPRVAAEARLRAETLARALDLPPDQQLYGVPTVPQQRGAR